ncbi:MAG: methyl-accepting chemotaxis protein [Planctomycetota bacterium]|jgi:methyl-accepting chemotaxis protein
MFKNLTVGKKIGFGFAAVLVLLLVVGGVSFFGVTGMSDDAVDTIAKNELIENLIAKEVDHLNWANKVSELLTNDQVTELAVQTDDHKCAFGKWLYGEGRKEAEAAIPKLATTLKALEQPHAHLHASAVEIGEHFEQADSTLPAQLAARMVDHLKWADVIRDAFLEHADSVDVQTDPTKCALGKWLATDAAHDAYANGDAEFKQAWDKMLLAHKHLHESANHIQEAFADGSTSEAGGGRAAAKELFDTKTLPLLHETLGSLEELKAEAAHGLEGMQYAKRVFAEQTEPALGKVRELLTGAIGTVKEEVERTNANMLGSASFTKLIVTVISSVAMLLGVVLAFVIARGIVTALKRVIDGMTAGAEQTSSAAGQVSSASQSLAQGASEAAAAIEETTASVEEMSSMIKTNAGNAGEAKTLSESASSAANKGAEAMGRMSGAIDDIKKSSDETAKIIKTIDEIAFQTNLLALNAAVEAARAGEAGKGFAVVAEEVRNLAQRSAEAARNTADLIEGSVKNSDNGVAISKEVGAALEEIADGSGKVNDLVAEIAAASNEQSQGADQISQAVSQMDSVTQSNAANAEESASASEELSAQAEELNKMVQELQVMVGGSKARSSFERDADRKATPAANLQSADQVWHQIATTPAGEQQADTSASAEEVIPMGEDTGLSKF